MTSSVREQRPRTVCVGEATVEFVRGGDGRFGMGCSGDTFNVAVYLARAGIDTAFATALGDDAYSDAILALATAEGVAGNLVLRPRGRLPGLVVVDTDATGGRRGYDWRGQSPARDLFELPDWGRVAEGLTKASLIYFSGITLSLYSNNGLGRFLALVEMARQQGVKVAFDGNFRPRSNGCRRSGSPRSWSRTGRTARWSPPADEANSSRCRRWWCRSTPRQQATASTPPISRRACPASGRPRRPAPRTTSPQRSSATAAR
jgi:sugar/nucleoside kinase (ribokinase family)